MGLRRWQQGRWKQSPVLLVPSWNSWLIFWGVEWTANGIPVCVRFGGQKLQRTLKSRQRGHCAGMVRSPGSVRQKRLLQLPVWSLPQDMRRRIRSPTRAGRAARNQEGPGCWKWLGGIETKWETQRQYTSTGTVDASTWEIEVPGNTWRREELGCVRPWLG